MNEKKGSNVNGGKSTTSYAFKRAVLKFGVGRYLYEDEQGCTFETEGDKVIRQEQKKLPAQSNNKPVFFSNTEPDIVDNPRFVNQTPSPTNGNGDKVISEKQSKLAFAILIKKHKTTELVKGYLHDNFNTMSTKDLTVKDLKKIQDDCDFQEIPRS